MELLVIRHAIAEDRETFQQKGKPDAERPLTERGRRRMRSAARGLATLVPGIDVLATSPYARAVETAEIVSRAFRDAAPTPMTVDLLTPEGSFEALLTWLGEEPADRTAIVGHEPHLSGFISWLLTGRHGSFVELKKGAASLLQLPPRGPAGSAFLRWALTPGQLRALDLAKTKS